MSQEAERAGLPIRPFLYTIDQIATIIGAVDERTVTKHLFFEGRSVGVCSPGQMVARALAPGQSPPDWRVAEPELIRWLRHKGFFIYEVNRVRK